MKKYITNLYGQSPQSTAMAAQNMITKISKSMGYKELCIEAYPVRSDTEEEKLKRIEGILASVSQNSLAIAQMPSWNGIAFDKYFLEVLRKKVEKLVVFIHDFVPLMFANNAYLFDQYLAAYNHADLVIVPSLKMKEILIEHGLTQPVLIQEVWDHLIPIDLTTSPQFQKKLSFLGNTTRFPFVKDWKSELPLEVYSNSDVQAEGNMKLMGWKPEDQLLRSLNIGGYGLVWSENIENQYEREYSEMNVSFKFSTYLAAGLPLIVNKGIAKESFVTDYHIGVAVETLEEAVAYVEGVSEEEYKVMVENVKNIGNLIREGFFTKKMLIEIQEKLFL
ncbi:sugar transferase [Lactococcus garvieae]|uniref:Glucosyltransferase 3 n=1 Tax=Lactococcus garvieae DCC43 TaxID=1231377 RepID=K2PWG8_9LACT|nr:sugar transferase [Lactococcus garvieae]EKF51786.1 Nucleotide sugar synthetase-like protein [Lactococcus garvieae DCC43]